MKPSLRRRLVAAVAALFAAAWLGVTTLTYVVAHHVVDHHFDAQLANDARTLLALTTRGGVSTQGEGAYAATGRVLPAFRAWRSGVLRVHSGGAPDFGRPDSLGYEQVLIDGALWRVFTAAVDDGSAVQVGEPLDLRGRVVFAITREVVFPLLLTLPLLAVVVWWSVGRGLLPLRRVTVQVAGQSPSRLKPIDARKAPEEIDALVDALNGLLELLRAALMRERRFSTDVGHEMRTPLAAIRVHAQLVARSELSPEQRRSMEDIVGSVDHLGRLGEQLLTLARVDGEALADHAEPIILQDVVGDAVAVLADAAIGQDIALHIDTDGARVFGHRDALAALVRNLVDNAVRYTPRGGRVVINVRDAGDCVALTVTDTGPGIVSDERERVFERFYRGGQAPLAEGCGLGLSIVQRIAALHRADVSLDDGPDGRGLRVSVRFPAFSAA